MIFKCIGGPCDGENHSVPDDAMIGHEIRLTLPVDAIRPDEPTYHPFSDKARDRIVQKSARYIYMEDSLNFVPEKRSA